MNDRLLPLILVAGLLSAGCQQKSASVAESLRENRAAPSVRNDAPSYPEIRPSRFLNTDAEVHYVGNAGCVACHEDEFQSYSETTHSRALQDVDVAQEPKPGEFHLPHSARTFRSELVGSRVWHRELIRAADGEEILLDSHPMKYAIGSGHHSRSYLAEIDGFLVESPMTWYRATGTWGLSPGFQRAQHASFERMADSGCLVCHAGRVEEIDGNRFRARVVEPVIGCENCHGPGGLHVQRHTANREPGNGQEDLTIVNPRRLARTESEAICAQCHLRGNATVAVRGRKVTDFRPGQQLADFRVDYFVEEPEGEMKVVGHVEQMWRSRCYQQSTELTCMTCHNPHAPVRDSERLAWHRERCLSCHAASACGLDESQRRESNPDDDCVACHMPRGKTDIPHFAFTHHRIGIHPASPPEAPAPPTTTPRFGRLLPSADLKHLSAEDQQRLLGLAQFEWADKQGNRVLRERYQQLAESQLQATVEAGMGDTSVYVALARLAWERGDLARAMEFANRALQGVPESQRDVNALFVLGDCYLQRGMSDLALPVFQQLVRLRRVSFDWSLLGHCQQQQGQIAAAWDSFRQAATISPAQPELLEMLIGLSHSLRDAQAEAGYRRRLRALQELSTSPAP